MRLLFSLAFCTIVISFVELIQTSSALPMSYNSSTWGDSELNKVVGQQTNAEKEQAKAEAEKAREAAREKEAEEIRERFAEETRGRKPTIGEVQRHAHAQAMNSQKHAHGASSSKP